MTNDEMDDLHARLRALRRSIDELVIDGVPRQNQKATRAMFTLLHARCVVDDLHGALLREARNTQLAKLAYLDARNGATFH